MAAYSSTEVPISRIFALHLPQELGCTYLSPEEVALERRGKQRFVLLEGILAKQLRRLNSFEIRGQMQRLLTGWIRVKAAR